jgi:hypothetical protein
MPALARDIMKNPSAPKVLSDNQEDMEDDKDIKVYVLK